MRGKYTNNKPDYLNVLIQNMTQTEQDLIVNNNFDALWCKLWGYGVEHHYNEYPHAKQQFESHNILKLVDANKSDYLESEWGFPKGRRIRCESDIDCAIREFNEETNISRDSYTILKNIQLSETFEGTNGVMYKHTYFLAIVNDESKINIDQKFTTMQRREISAISWKTLDECRQLTRPHYTDRIPMLISLESILTTFETLATPNEQ
jgi:8-oxo-dGTP pyrophosphatase MutT (NUDIX family)